MKSYGTGTCEVCGKEYTRTGSRQIRCPKCAKEINRLRAKQQQREFASLRKRVAKERKWAPKVADPHECKRKDCIYKATAGGIKICDYLGSTGKLRGCPVQGCIKYTKGKKSRTRKVLDINNDEFREVEI